MPRFDNFRPEHSGKQQAAEGLTEWGNQQAISGQPKIVLFGGLSRNAVRASQDAVRAFEGVHASACFYTFAPEGNEIKVRDRIHVVDRWLTGQVCYENPQSPIVGVLSADFLEDLITYGEKRPRDKEVFLENLNHVATEIIVNARPNEFNSAPAFDTENSTLLLAEGAPYPALGDLLTADRIASLADRYASSDADHSIFDADILDIGAKFPSEVATLSYLRERLAPDGMMPGTIWNDDPPTYVLTDRSEQQLRCVSEVQYRLATDDFLERSPREETATVVFNNADDTEAICQTVFGLRQATNRSVIHDVSGLPATLWPHIDQVLRDAEVSRGMRRSVVLRSGTETVSLHRALLRREPFAATWPAVRPGQALRHITHRPRQK
ncbi:MAG: hypothetical protein HOQ05_12335 [Corynebacteriales bacterium]|nr:hypothetical protein [Mycobacteriales bacterium]